MTDYEHSDKQITCWSCGKDYYDDGTEACPVCGMCPSDEVLDAEDDLIIKLRENNKNKRVGRA